MFIVSKQYKEPINNKGSKYQEVKLTFCFPVEKLVSPKSLHFEFSSIASLFKIRTSLKGMKSSSSWYGKSVFPHYVTSLECNYSYTNVTLFVLMDLPVHIDAIRMGLSIAYFKGSQVGISKL